MGNLDLLSVQATVEVAYHVDYIWWDEANAFLASAQSEPDQEAQQIYLSWAMDSLFGCPQVQGFLLEKGKQNV